jgi:hypothetical protein
MDNFKQLLEQIAALLKAYNYTKKGSTFFLEKSGNKGLIDFQKSKNKPSDGTSFTINLGIFSTELWRRTGDPVKEKPDISMCHWSQRIGFLLPQKEDYWFLIPDNTPADVTISEIRKIITEIAIPVIDTHIADEDLAEAWLKGEGGGLTKYTRFTYLTTLLKIKNDPRLPAAVDELKSLAKTKTMEYSIKEFLKDLQIESA